MGKVFKKLRRFYSFMETYFPIWLLLCIFTRYDNTYSAALNDHADVSKNDDPVPPTKSSTACNANNGLIIINTIDGNLTALDPKSGNLCWKTNVNSLGLISSSLENLQVVDNGANMRLVPSLDGRLFKFEDGKLEPLPITAESMLKSSSKIGDNLSIIGERQKKVLGFDLQSGEICYECTSKGCHHFLNTTENENLLVVEQIAHSVHAVNSKKGVSQWNFRVAELQLTIASEIIKTFDEDTVNDNYKFALVTEGNLSQEGFMSTIKIAMNGGYIGNFNKSFNKFDWFQKLSNPIVDVWYVKEKIIYALDQFDEKFQFHLPNGPDRNSAASLFVGIFKNQLFIKQSKKLKSKITDIKAPFREAQCTVPNAVSTMTPLADDGPKMLLQDKENSLVSLEKTEVVPIFDHGVYYYVNYTTLLNNTHCVLNSSFPMTILHVWDSNSLKAWIVITITTLILTLVSTVFVYRLFMKPTINALLNNDNLAEVNVDENSISDRKESESNTTIEKLNVVEPEFVSRFLQDFTINKVLGKGGYGLVIEARNKIDDRCYAVKRIQYFEDKAGENMFTKVMREVKALAMLDHPGIVRYFNAWTEVPPDGWQKDKDVEHNITDKNSEFSSASSAKNVSSSTYPEKIQLKNVLNNPIRNALKNNPLRQVLDNNPLRNAMNYNPLQPFDIDDDSSCLSDDVEDKKNSTCTRHGSETSYVSYLYIQMQLCRKDTLRDWLTKNDSSRKQNYVLRMFNQIVEAVEYVHRCGLMHRDLKPSNIFFSLDGNIKIGDFGLAATNAMVEESEGCDVISPADRTKEVGTFLYMSPEQRVRENYDSKTDIFSLGIIFFELLVPFHSSMERVKVISQVRTLQFPKDFIDNFKSEHQLAVKMLQANPKHRPTASVIKYDPLFD